jgi:peptide/nickel transport system permease protein
VDPRAWQRFRRNKGAVVGLVVVTLLVLFALVGPMVSGQSPDVPDFAHGRARFGMPAPPSALHWLGTDVIFRDELARLATGARFSLEVGVAATLIAIVIGTAVGVISGWYKGTRVPFDHLLDVVAFGCFGVAVVALVCGADVTGWRLLGLAAYLGLGAIVVRAIGALRFAVRKKSITLGAIGVARVLVSSALLALPFVPRIPFGHRAAFGVVLACAALFAIRRLRPPGDLDARRLHVDLDDAMMRTVDVLLAFPFLLLLMAIAAAVEHTTRATVFLVLGLTAWTGTARILRSKTLQVREHEFIVASRALGQSTPRILVRHVLPNVAGLAVVLATNSIAAMIVAEAALSFLGLSIPPPAASWGRMLDEGRAYYSAAPWLLAAPAIAIVLAVLGFNLLGEGLRDALDARE